MSCDCRPPYLGALRASTALDRGAFVGLVGGLAAATALPALAAGQPPDTILINARVRTMARRRPQAAALAITAGRFSAVGSKAQILALRGPRTHAVDAQGATVLPGFVEPHMHFIYSIVTENLLVATYPEVTSLAAFLTALKGGLAKVPAGQWYGAFGFDNSVMAPYRQLTLHDLDSVSTEIPIVVINPSGHIAYANSKAFALAGVTAHSPPVAGGGHYGKDANGALNGVIYEPPAMERFLTPIIKSVNPTAPKLLGWYASLLNTAAESGVTTVHDAGIGPTGKVPDDWALYTQLVNRPNNPVRISTMPDFQEHASFDAFVAKIARTPGRPIFLADGRLSVPCVKFWADGSLQGYTGALTQPYADQPHTKGSLNWEPAALNGLVTLAKQHGWSTAIHANGDAGLDLALGALEAAYGPGRAAGFRNRIEHCTVTRPEQWAILEKMALAVSFTEGHVYEWGLPFATRILGPSRAAGIDNARESIRRGIVWTMNSDFATTDIQPLRYIQTAVTRLPLGATSPLGPALRVSVMDALRAMTINGAMACQLEDRIGTIEVGKEADLVELGADPVTVDPSTIAGIPVHATWSRGMRFAHA